MGSGERTVGRPKIVSEKKFYVRVDEETYQWWKREARGKGTTIAALMRDVLLARRTEVERVREIREEVLG